MDKNSILLFLAVKYEGDWEKIYNAIRRREVLDAKEVDALDEQYKNRYITMMDDKYPKRLMNSYRPPIVLFYKGDLSLLDNEKALAVIGTRHPSIYGREVTTNIINQLDKDIVIVSGAAKGIDAVAHKSALDAGLKTIAVLGNGTNIIYPTENADLYKRIEEKGLIISEYPDNLKPDKDHFPVRNRIIAALSKGILVTEAKEKSGTSITVSYGLEFGKNIYAIPNPVTLNEISFPNELIKHGASIVTSGQDINLDM